MIGGTYKITPELTAYAGYSEANRAPTPLELGCADPARPCIIAAFLVSDPPLKQVVSHTVEAGLRGTKELNIGTLGWKIGGFRATNYDDILAIPSPELQGFGYFQNVGRTRRQGIEAEVNLKSRALQLYASYAFVDARFLDALQVGSNSPFADENGNIQILPGNQVPAVPRHRVKAGFDYAITDAFKVGADATLRQQSVFCRRRVQPGGKTNVLCRGQCPRFLPDQQDLPDLRPHRQRLRQPLRDLRHLLRHRPPCPISPMAVRRSPTPDRSARRGRAHSMPD